MRAVLIAVALLAGGCSMPATLNPMHWFGLTDPPGNRPTPLSGIAATVTPRAAWSASVGRSSGFYLRPASDGTRVFAAAADGVITVIDEASGRVLSRHETKKKISGGVQVAENRIIVGTLKGEVLALDTSGGAAWATTVAGEVISPAAVSRNTVVVRTSDGRIFGLALDDGKRQWVYQRPTPSLLLRSEAGVLAIGSDVVAGYPNGKLIALDLEDGKLTWEATVSPPRGTTELERIADIAGLPLVDGPRVCAVAFQGKAACFEIQTRNMVWSRDVSSSRALAADGKSIYIVDSDGNVLALDKVSGASLWKQEKLRYRRLSAPVTYEGRIVVGDLAGYLHVLSADDGALVGRLATDGSPIHALVTTSGGILVQTERGTVSLVRF